MNAIGKLSVNEIGRIYDRLAECRIPETIHITQADFVLRFWMRGECLVVRDVPGQRPEVGFLDAPNVSKPIIKESHSAEYWILPEDLHD